MTDFENQKGRIIAERYRLTALLGQGGMGSVWRAEHLTLGSEVAIKLINAEVATNEEVRTRFVREAKAAAGLRSPHVVQILDYGVDGDTPYIAMELMEGESLSDRLDREKCLTLEETSGIITQVARALSKAHEAGIVHRDLKPDNIFLVHNDDSDIAKVLDFGVAKQVLGTENAHMTTTGAVMGTPYYMSPEQAEGAKTLDHRTDVWAMTVIAYECILGVRPFNATTLGGLFMAICARDKPVPSRVSHVPAGFDEWFHRGTARDVNVRFENARAAAQALRALCDSTSEGQLNNDASAAIAQPMAMPTQTSNPHLKPHLSTAPGSSVAVPPHTTSSNKILVIFLLILTVAVIGWVTTERLNESDSADLNDSAAPTAAPTAATNSAGDDHPSAVTIIQSAPTPHKLVQPKPTNKTAPHATPTTPLPSSQEPSGPEGFDAGPKPAAVRRAIPKKPVFSNRKATPAPDKTQLAKPTGEGTPPPEKKPSEPAKPNVDLGI